MKNKFLLLLILGVTFFVSCSDDDDKAWKNIPQDEIEIQKVTFEVNGEQATTGTLQMAVKNGSEAVLTLKNVIPGYATIPVNVKLEEQADDSFVFSGEEGLTTPPAMLIVRSDAKPVILNVKVEGKIRRPLKNVLTLTICKLARDIQPVFGEYLTKYSLI